MKKGFTLIELLAVIVILAIIALIATPIILGIINDAREESQERSVELYENAVELAIARKNLTEDFNPSSCTISNGIVTCDGTELKVEVDGEAPKEGTIIFKENKIESAELVFEKYKATINENGKITITDKTETTPTVTKACTYVDSEDDTGAAIGVIDLSDVVTCGTESFYVMENDGSNITMLAQYNLNINNSYPDGTAGIQNENVVGGQPESSIIKYGGTYFSTNIYWVRGLDSSLMIDTNYSQEGRSYPYIYGDYKDANGNQQNKIYTYIESYEKYLKENGVNSASATLMSYEQAVSLGCSTPNCASSPSWLHSTAYWLGSSELSGMVFHMSTYDDGRFYLEGSFGDLHGSDYCTYGSCGVRPVVTINTSEIG